MNIYHIAYAPAARSVHLHFWGCNLACRACLLLKEIYDCHLEETKEAIFESSREAPQSPQRFLELEEVLEILSGLEVGQAVFMGAEPSTDAELPRLAKALHERWHTHNILLTNGLRLPPLNDIDEVVVSIKAHTDRLHRHYTSKSNRACLRNFAGLWRSGARLRAESVLIPGYIDCPEIGNIARFIAGVDRDIPYRIDAYLPVGDNPWRRPTPEEMDDAVERANRHLSHVSCLKGTEPLKYEVVRVF